MWSALDQIMSTGNIQQTPKKISKSSTTANISFESVVAGFANQLETYLARRTFMQTGIAHCSLLLRTCIYGRPLRQDKLLSPLLCRPSERNLKNFISFKTVISDLSLQGAGRWETLWERGWRSFASSHRAFLFFSRWAPTYWMSGRGYVLQKY